jgi:hypothetical protein
MSTKDIAYDYVTMTKGPDKGRVFYYDDDEFDAWEYDGEKGRGDCAILYPRAFLGGSYFLVPHRGDYFRLSTPEEVAAHTLEGNALWSSGAPRIFRDILTADIKSAAESTHGPDDPPRDIAVDTKAALEAVLAAPPEKRREALVWLGVMVKTWIELTEQEQGDTPEQAALRAKARKRTASAAAVAASPLSGVRSKETH